MKPLLSIKTVPMTIERKITPASLQYKQQKPSFDIAREKGRQEIRTDPAKINIDSKEMRASIGLKSTGRVIREAAETGKRDAMEATGQYAEDGNFMRDSMQAGGSPTPIPDLAMSKSIRKYETALAFIPTTRPEMSMQGGTIAFNYTADQLNFNWDISTRPYLEYVPANFEVEVTQYHEVIIEYLGDPIYVPPSSNPNYTPPPSLEIDA